MAVDPRGRPTSVAAHGGGHEKEAPMLKVWGRRSSFNVQKVLWLVGELGLAHEHTPAGGDFGRLDEPSFRALNPHGRVPVIEDGDLAVWESHAILRYLAARYDPRGLWSADPAERARVDSWMDWSQSTLQPDFPHGRLLGLLSHARLAARLAGDPQESRALRQPFSAPGRGSGGAAVPRRREVLVGGYSRRHVALSLFRARYRTSERCERDRLVSAPARAAGVPPARHDPLCRLARPSRTLSLRRLSRAPHSAPHQARALSRDHVDDRRAPASGRGGSAVRVHHRIRHTPASGASSEHAQNLERHCERPLFRVRGQPVAEPEGLRAVRRQVAV